MTSENVVTKGEIVHTEQFLLLPQYVQLYSMFKLLLIGVYHISYQRIAKSSAEDFLLYLGKSKIRSFQNNICTANLKFNLKIKPIKVKRSTTHTLVDFYFWGNHENLVGVGNSPVKGAEGP